MGGCLQGLGADGGLTTDGEEPEARGGLTTDGQGEAGGQRHGISHQHSAFSRIVNKRKSRISCVSGTFPFMYSDWTAVFFNPLQRRWQYLLQNISA